MSEFFYVCHFCGFCAAAVGPVQEHLSKCKTFGLRPLQLLNKFVSEDSNVVTLPSSRSARHRKSDDAKCEECGVVRFSPSLKDGVM